MGIKSSENGKCTFYNSGICKFFSSSSSLIIACLSHRISAMIDVQSESVGGNRTKLFYVGFKGEVKNSSMDMSQLGRVQAAGTADSQVDGVAEKKGSGYTTIH